MRSVMLIAVLVLCASSVLAVPRITQLSVTPQPVAPGSNLEVAYTLMGDTSLGQVATDITLPGAINDHQVAQAGLVYRFDKTYPIPSDYTGPQRMELRVVPEYGPGIQQAYRVEVTPLPTLPQQNYSTDTIHVTFDPLRNIPQGSTVYFPVTITNTYSTPKQVLLGMQGARTWSTFAVEPTQYLTIPANSERTAYLSVSIDKDAPLGMHQVTFTVDYDNTHERLDSAFAVLSAEPAKGFSQWLVSVIIVVVLIALIILAIAWNRRKEKEDEELITHY